MNSVKDWGLDAYPFEWKSDPVQLEMRIRSSIFIIAGVCAGLPALVWSVSDIIHHRKNGHCISIFIILLLLTDFIELFLSPYILIKMVLNEMSWYTNVTFWGVLWSLSRVYGFLLNLLVALEEIISVKFLRVTNAIFLSPGFRLLYIFVALCITIGSSFVFFCKLNNYISIFTCIMLEITWVSFCGLSCSYDFYSHTSKKTDHHILVIFLFSLVIYLNYFLTLILEFSLHIFVQTIPFSLLSLRLISDPLLCVLVCRQNLSLQTSQKPE